MRAIDLYFDTQPEPAKSCLLALRKIILDHNKIIREDWKYNMPFYFYGKERICYLWVDKKSGQPYLGIVNGVHIDDPLLLQEDRTRMKVMRFDAIADLPEKNIRTILEKAIQLHLSSHL